MNIIPAIDLIEGRCVRLMQGRYSQCSTYEKSPLDMARAFEDAGLRSLHLVDLDGARAGSLHNLSTLESIASQTDLQIDFSGGIRSRAAISQAFDAGADLLCVGSAAVLNPEEVCLWLEEYGPEKFILSADVRGRRLAISGWTEDTDLSIDSFVADWKEHQIFTFLCTAIQRDGMLAGPDFSLYSELGEAFPDHTFIVSGGVSSINDIRVLQDRGAKAVVIGRAIYEGKITLDQLRGVAC